MREILFRGKRIDGHRDNTKNGTMLYGSLFIDKNGQPKIKWYCEKHGSAMTSNVDPETVGQYTGLTDKNGKKIFEGDVVKAERICNGKAWLGSVVWWNGCFAIQGIKDRNVPAIDLFVEHEVIGNIHDNPELLEVSK